jgi:hypothetical protein
MLRGPRHPLSESRTGLADDAAMNVHVWRLVGRIALTATLYEVSARRNRAMSNPFSRGATPDMDYSLFSLERAALAPFFAEFGRIGGARTESRRTPAGFRKVGLAAEKAIVCGDSGRQHPQGTHLFPGPSVRRGWPTPCPGRGLNRCMRARGGGELSPA